MLRLTLFSLVAISFSATSFTHAFTTNWLQLFSLPGSPKPVDCRWMSWYNASGCEQSPPSKTYRIKQRREKVSEKNGGKPCSGSNEQYISCSEMEFMGARFYATVRSTSSSSSTPAYSDTIPNRWNIVQRGEGREVRMVGAQQYSSGRKRRRSQREQELHRKKRTPTLSYKSRDILFLIDESGSIGQYNFKKFLRMAKALTNSFCGTIEVSQQQTRIGVMSFDKKQHVHLNFDRYFLKSHILNFMNTSIPYSRGTSGSTCLVDALKYTRSNMITVNRGARVNVPGTERVVIMLTSACANCVSNQGDLETALATLRGQFEADGIAFITFFVGQSESCILKIKALADGSKCHEVFRYSNWAKFDQATTTIENGQPCMDSWKIGIPC